MTSWRSWVHEEQSIRFSSIFILMVDRIWRWYTVPYASVKMKRISFTAALQYYVQLFCQAGIIPRRSFCIGHWPIGNWKTKLLDCIGNKVNAIRYGGKQLESKDKLNILNLCKFLKHISDFIRSGEYNLFIWWDMGKWQTELEYMIARIK